MGNSEETVRAIIARFAEDQKRDWNRYCPRCGHFTVKERLHTNAYSRHADVYICDGCGRDEAWRDYMDMPLPLEEWALVRGRGVSVEGFTDPVEGSEET